MTAPATGIATSQVRRRRCDRQRLRRHAAQGDGRSRGRTRLGDHPDAGVVKWMALQSTLVLAGLCGMPTACGGTPVYLVTDWLAASLRCTSWLPPSGLPAASSSPPERVRHSSERDRPARCPMTSGSEVVNRSTSSPPSHRHRPIVTPRGVLAMTSQSPPAPTHRVSRVRSVESSAAATGQVMACVSRL